MFRIKDLHIRFDQRFSLDIPAFDFQAGRRYVLLGVNGSGKTTLLRALAGLGSPAGPNGPNSQNGLITWIGAPALQPGDLGYMPQTPYAFALSVLANVRLAIPPAWRQNKAADCALALQALEKVGIAHLAAARADRLSGGETQRLALARILVVPRRVILLDEPGHSLDLAGLAAINGILDAYVRECGCLLILVTHQLAMVRQLADDVLFLDQGQLISHGPPEQILDRPADPRLQLLLSQSTLL